MTKRKNDKTHSITIDNDLWELANIELGNKRSKLIENFLRDYLNANNDIEELKKEIEELESELKAKKLKLERLKEIEEKNNKNNDIILNAMYTVNNIVKANGFISIRQIQFIADKNNINKDILTKEIKAKNIKITKYGNEIKETNKKNNF